MMMVVNNDDGDDDYNDDNDDVKGSPQPKQDPKPNHEIEGRTF